MTRRALRGSSARSWLPTTTNHGVLAHHEAGDGFPQSPTVMLIVPDYELTLSYRSNTWMQSLHVDKSTLWRRQL